MFTGYGCKSYTVDTTKGTYSLYSCDVSEEVTQDLETYRYGILAEGTWGYSGYECKSYYPDETGLYNVYDCE